MIDYLRRKLEPYDNECALCHCRHNEDSNLCRTCRGEGNMLVAIVFVLVLVLLLAFAPCGGGDNVTTL